MCQIAFLLFLSLISSCLSAQNDENVYFNQSNHILLAKMYGEKLERVLTRQASSLNPDYKKEVAKLENHFRKNSETERLVAKVCGKQYMTRAHFLRYLATQRRHFKKIPVDQAPIVQITQVYPTYEFEIIIPLVSLMNYRTEMIFQIETQINADDTSMSVRWADISGGCTDWIDFGRAWVDTTWKVSQDGQMNETILDSLIDSTIFRQNFTDSLVDKSLFYTDFRAIIDTNVGETYTLDQFLKYMRRFSQRYTLRRDKKSHPTMSGDDQIEAKTVVITHSADHLVFRTAGVYQFNYEKNTFDVWQFQVEAIFNETWKISQLFLSPSHDFLHFPNLTEQRASVQVLEKWRNKIAKNISIDGAVPKNVNYEKCSNIPKISNLKNVQIVGLKVFEYSPRLQFEIQVQYELNAHFYAISTNFSGIYNSKFEEYYMKNITMGCPQKGAYKNAYHTYSKYAEEKDIKEDNGHGAHQIRLLQLKRKIYKAGAEVYAWNISKLFLQQSSIDNLGHEAAAKNLRDQFQPFCDHYKCLVAKLCDGQEINIDYFFDHLSRQRRRFAQPLFGELPVFDIASYSPLVFQTTISLQSRMGFRADQILDIETIRTAARGEWKIKRVNVSGGCTELLDHDRAYVASTWKENYGDGKITENIFEHLINETILRSSFPSPTNFSYAHFDTSLFALIETHHDDNITFNLDAFIYYMQRFTTRYTLRRDKTEASRLFDPSGRAATAIITQSPDHLVFRTKSVYQYNFDKPVETLDFWEFQVEAVYNRDSDKLWKVTQIIMQPPNTFIWGHNFAEFRSSQEFQAEWQVKIQQNIQQIAKIVPSDAKFIKTCQTTVTQDSTAHNTTLTNNDGSFSMFFKFDNTTLEVKLDTEYNTKFDEFNVQSISLIC